MALYPYVATLAVDPVTLVKAAGATGTIFAPEDTGFASPLTATDATGNPIPLTANADGILPSFYSTSPAVNWRSGSYTFPLVTSQPLPGPEGQPGQPGNNGQDGLPGVNAVPTAEAVATYATTPGNPVNTALSATILDGVTSDPAKQELRNTFSVNSRQNRQRAVAFLGDSITSNGGLITQQNPSYQHKLATESLGRIQVDGVYATGGHTLEMIENDRLPLLLAMDPLPGWAFVFGGTNNTGSNGGAGFNFEAAKATLLRIIGSLEAVGIRPVLVAIPPRSDSATVSANVSAWNAWVKGLALTRGHLLFDAYTPCVGADGKFKAGYSVDGVHPTDLGYEAMVRYNIANGFVEAFPPYQRPPAFYRELISNGRFLVADGTVTTIGQGWSTQPSNNTAQLATAFVQPDGGDLLRGRWQQVTFKAGFTGQIFHTVTSTEWAIGETIELEARVRVTGLLAANSKLLAGVTMLAASSSPSGPYQWGRDVEDGLIRMRRTIPAGTTGLRFVLSITGTPAVDVIALIGEVSVRNLSRPSI